MATAGVERIEVLRQSSSVMYGSDALSGVVNITTRRGRTRIPQLDVSADGGNFNTRHGSAALGGAVKRLDYFSEYAYFNTDNSTPNNAYRNGTYAGRFGVAVGRGTDLSGTIRRVDTRSGSPNAFDLYGVADDARQNSGGVFAEARGSVMMRTYVPAGIGFEHNEAFDNAVTPRLSVATYLRNPSATSALGDTKITFNAGKGIKAPSVFQQENALFTLVQSTSAAANASPLGPERSTSIDIGIEQGFWYGRARVRTAYFHNQYENLIEFLNRTQLTQAGVPASVAAATAFGAYLNSSSFRAQGVETSFDAAIGQYVRMNASYTYLGAVVTKAFGAVAAINPSIPGVPIGAFSPLVGQRPFRRPPQSGSVMITVMRGPGQVTFSGYFSGKRDDSTFLSDQFFGNSLLLPNRNLDPAYQKLDLSASYRVHARVSLYTSIENLLDQHYDASFGFPSLPRAARAGARLTVGGD